MKYREYYIAVDLVSMNSQMFTTKKGAADYLNISPQTVYNGLSRDYKILKPGAYMITKSVITKSHNKGNIDNLINPLSAQ